MKRSIEIRNEIAEKRQAMASLREQNKIDEAHALYEEIKNLKKELEVEEELERKVPSFESEKTANDKTDALKVFNKAVRGIKLTDVEAELVEKIDKKGGYLVPKEQATQIEELKREYCDLKQYCDVVSVSTLSGSYVVEVEDDGTLIEFDEGERIPTGSLEFDVKDWKVKSAGMIIPVTNELFEDEKADLMSHIIKTFAKRATRSDNKKIIAKLLEAETFEGDNYNAIDTALNTKLNVAIKAGSIIVTNQTGYNYLDGLKDAIGRPLLKDSLTIEGGKMYAGKNIVITDDTLFVADDGKLAFWVGDMQEFIKFFDRKSYEVAVSEHAAFYENSTVLRCTQRTDVQINDDKAGMLVTIPTVSSTPNTTDSDATKA